MGFHDPVAERQPDAGARADVLGREQRLEDAGLQLLRDAGAVVGDPELDELPELQMPRLDGQSPRPIDLVEGVFRVHDQVGHHLSELVGVHHHRRQ